MFPRNLMVPNLLVMVAILLARLCDARCDYEAIFNFGDSNSDTGGFWWAFPETPSPNGMTYFKHPVGRASDGRLMIDFIAERIGVPYVSPYLKSIGSDYRHGANFATYASTALIPETCFFVSRLSPFALPIQLNQMKHFKAQLDKLHSKGSSNLPPPHIFGKSLYTIYIGQNDFTSNLVKNGINGVKKTLPKVISQITSTIKELHGLGGRTFLVQNLAPIGCYPAFLVFLVLLPHSENDIDEFGCLISYNKAVVEYNNMLHEALRSPNKETTFRCQSHLCRFSQSIARALPTSDFSWIELWHISMLWERRWFLQLQSESVLSLCGNNKIVNGQNLTASACSDPGKYVSWDGIHVTEAASKIVVDKILGSGFTDPPFEIRCS